jgi:CDP-paratose 2-epimerase
MVLAEIQQLTGTKLKVRHDAWREGDQLYFVAETSRLKAELGWRPRMDWRAGLHDLADWLSHREGRPLAQEVRA